MNDVLYPDLASIDGQAINIGTLKEAVAAPLAFARTGRGFCFFTFNLDHMVKRRDDAAFRAAYEKANLVSADGAPVAWLARKQAPSIERTTGADLVKPLAIEAARQGVKIAFFGTTDHVLQKSAEALQAIAPGLDIVHRESPPLGFDPTSSAAEAACQRIAESGARIVFVALGAPKQEIFAAKMSEKFPNLGFICIGAALDFIAGTQVRAPKAFQMLGLEWFWRLATNPKRMARRYALCAAVFASVTLKGSPRASEA
jgi:N-acetylglucosaminyldiphosphoundecaprenol N-acetyl-beta-D-mannosaminyltransferase